MLVAITTLRGGQLFQLFGRHLDACTLLVVVLVEHHRATEDGHVFLRRSLALSDDDALAVVL